MTTSEKITVECQQSESTLKVERGRFSVFTADFTKGICLLVRMGSINILEVAFMSY